MISVGAVDDLGTKAVDDDLLAEWSSRGTTQDGFAKPEILAPGAHMVSTLAPGAEITRLCPSASPTASTSRSAAPRWRRPSRPARSRT